MTIKELENKVLYLEKKQKEIDEHLKNIEEKIRLASIGFPVNFF